MYRLESVDAKYGSLNNSCYDIVYICQVFGPPAWQTSVKKQIVNFYKIPVDIPIK